MVAYKERYYFADVMLFKYCDKKYHDLWIFQNFWDRAKNIRDLLCMTKMDMTISIMGTIRRSFPGVFRSMYADNWSLNETNIISERDLILSLGFWWQGDQRENSWKSIRGTASVHRTSTSWVSASRIEPNKRTHSVISP